MVDTLSETTTLTITNQCLNYYLLINGNEGSPTPTGSASAQPVLGTQSATTTTHMMLSKFIQNKVLLG